MIIVLYIFAIRQFCLIPLHGNQCMSGGLYVYFIYHKKKFCFFFFYNYPKSKEMLEELQLAVLPASHEFH